MRVPDHPFTSQQAAALGLSDHRLRTGLAAGEIRRVVRGVYVPAGLEDTVDLRAAAVALVVRPHQVVCDRTAAWLHRVDVFGLTDKSVLPPVEVCALRGYAVTALGGVDGRTRDLGAEDLMDIQGLRVTTPLRTALDLACGLGQHRALGALDQFMRHHGVTQWEMRHLLLRYRRRRGVIQARRLIPLADPRAESPMESWVRLDICLAGLPVPELQHRIEIDGVLLFRLDHAYPAHRVAVEYDGEEWHRRTDEQREHDRKRREWLRRHGWTVIVVDKDGVHDPSQRWLRDLREALRPRTRRLRWAAAY
jgi:very-short-patch-repair endonuclease